MSPQEQPPPRFPFHLHSPSGLSLQVNANGSIRRLDHGDIMLNLFLGTEIEGGPANLYLRRHGASIEATPLVGPQSPGCVRPGRRGLQARGAWREIRFLVSLTLAESGPAWFWHVTLANTGVATETLDLVYAQDLALAHYGAVRLNEFYTSHYVDHTALLHPQRGVVVVSRQNQSMGGRNPWAVIGSLGRGVSYATDALQFHGLATRAGQPPVGLVRGLPGARLQHEHSMVALQDDAVRLAPGEVVERGFFGWFEADHPQATTSADLAAVDRATNLPEAAPAREQGDEVGVEGGADAGQSEAATPGVGAGGEAGAEGGTDAGQSEATTPGAGGCVGPEAGDGKSDPLTPTAPGTTASNAGEDGHGWAPVAATLFSAAPLLETLDLTVAEVTELFGRERREEERVDGRLLSFFADPHRHVVMKAKELGVLRPHAHILRTGQGLVPDEASLTSTVWMGGVFHSLTTQGHVSINRFLSTVHGYLGMLRGDGQRLFVEVAGDWRLLDVPSAFEMTPQECLWVYRTPDGTITVRSGAATERHELTLAVQVLSGPPVRLLLSHHLAVNGDDGSEAVPARVLQDDQGVLVRPLPDTDLGRRFPEGGFHLAPLPGTVLERVGGDEMLFTDGRSRGQPFLCLLTAPARSAGLLLTGSLIPETPLAAAAPGSAPGTGVITGVPVPQAPKEPGGSGIFPDARPVPGSGLPATRSDEHGPEPDVARPWPAPVGVALSSSQRATPGNPGQAEPGQSDRQLRPETDDPGLPGRPEAARFWTDLTRRLRLHPPAASSQAGAATRFGEILPWFAHNALIHYLAPRGIEQYTGGGWGTRDICQGAVEMLSALGRFEPLRDLLIRVFKTQNPDGDWPQWFMFFDRERNIRPGDSHGDVVFWPLAALAEYLAASEDAALLDEIVPFFHPEGDDRAEHARLWHHVERALAVIDARVVPGTRLAAYGHGDWNDSMQPFDPAMRERLCSAWTVTLHVQTFAALAAACRRLGQSDRAAGFAAAAAAVRDEFQRLLIVDGALAGYAYFQEGGRVDYLVHPLDRTTGLSYSLLPMIHAVINDLFTPQQAGRHLDLIREHLLGPDGARLFDRPMAYRGGAQKHFQRAETAAFFGREIGLMYTHAHLRYAEALAHYGDAEGFLLALSQAIPVGIRDRVPAATLRQANCYYSSSDAAFADRYQASAEYGRVKSGEVALDGGWRIYSSGAGIWIRLFLQGFLGVRRQKSVLIVDPVIPASLDGLRAEMELEGHSLEITYRIRAAGSGPLSLSLNDRDLAFTRGANPYRTGAAEVSMRLVRERLREGLNRMNVSLG